MSTTQTQVYVLVISSRDDAWDGNHVTVHTTHAGARRKLVAYCAEWWDDTEMPECPKPEDDDEMVNTYFEEERLGDESYEIYPCMVNET